MTYNSEEWIFEQHRQTNHKYDDYVPYEFHLKMVKSVADRFFYLIDKQIFFEWKDNAEELTRYSSYTNDYKKYKYDITEKVITLACYGHDLIEDTRVSYNDVKNKLGEDVANIIYALTNEKGKTRSERANDKYYEGIRNTKGAPFVKLCDRIANVQYSKDTNSSMFDKYKKENLDFMYSLCIAHGSGLQPMVDHLIKLFKD